MSAECLRALLASVVGAEHDEDEAEAGALLLARYLVAPFVTKK